MSVITSTDIAFYEDEAMRWPELHGVPISDAGAALACGLLTLEFRLLKVPLKFIEGVISWGGSDGIELAEARDWLVFAHEFAHVLDCSRSGATGHTKRMAKVVDEVARVVLAADWVQADLDAQVDQLLKKRRALAYGNHVAHQR